MLSLSAELQDQLRPKLAGRVLVLDLDDGVGGFSPAGICSLNEHFVLIAAAPSAITPEFNATIASTLGPVRVKDYTQAELSHNPQLSKVNGAWQLRDDTGVLDSQVELRVVDAPALA
ncbi:iron-sulfur cluster biosynthesis family protein [Lacticaseibacillus nasuensis]|uniref:Core domain-containing protein n=1 Tax=Lacticaseibacillus nasuensis JCM 17158 TaxID=1291734 RepID=A0A0R1JVV4_9LACO|nr:iron-sulfur cluster biosynthesis family protein [Lacticaseibacillus nasuensis]KRK71778.1 hypothetical protein FD02_GL002023 [Lacticaseibacillus nasuensis JCM 17158]